MANVIVATGASQFEVLEAFLGETAIAWEKVTFFHLEEYVGHATSSSARGIRKDPRPAPPPSVRDEGTRVPDFYAGLKAINRRLRCDFFEGVVMKRGNAPYPMQLRSDTEECRAWAKHRFVN
jgi:hypothetical protein